MLDNPLAVLVNAENISANHYLNLRSQLAKLGRMVVFRLFGDFSDNILAPWIAHARTDHLEIEMQLSGGKGKNSADMLMTIHAMDILHARTANRICLVSSDRDFAPLATRLRASHMQVFGFGEVKSAP